MTNDNENIFATIQEQLKSDDIVLYMKGNAKFPQCGFSAATVDVLNSFGVNFKEHNILLDPELRQGIKDFSQWPTIPQLYVKEEFVGGCDIIREMAESGELEELFKEKKLISNQ